MRSPTSTPHSDAGPAPEGALPRWDPTSLFPALSSREFASAHERFTTSIGRLVALYDDRNVRGGLPQTPSPQDIEAVEEVLRETNDVLTQHRTLAAYLSTLVTSDARNDEAARIQSDLSARASVLQALSKRLESWVARLGADALIAAGGAAADHAYPLRRAEVAAAWQMAEPQEGLYAELAQTGSGAWAKLHGDLTARLVADVDWPGEGIKSVPVTIARGLATHGDPAVRRAAFEAEQEAWERVSVPLAAALNAIKGEANIVNRRRGWPDALAPALWENGVDCAALDAMHTAATGAFPDFRRYLRAKARRLGHVGGLPWWDLLAPASAVPPVEWQQATDAVKRAFSGYSPALATVASRALAEGWVDAAPREAKRGGAFCMGVRADESRVLLNFDRSPSSVLTLAHELGHAYHNTALACRTPLQSRLPMALAETASIFCETLMTTDGLSRETGAARLALLDTDLAGACQVVVDIHSRFLFEQALFVERRSGFVGVEDLCRLMREAQEATYGDGLDPDTYHPYMWAVKPHYYSRSFYNWPYTFGLLFGIGLPAHYVADPDRFRHGYDGLLASTGLASAADLASGFGIDIASVDFWDSSLDVLRGRIDEYCAS
ncbi:MAG: M3 family oligoendopeptidase [Acidimicrobiales bacterium]